METDEAEPRVTPFQLQFDKPVASQIKIAEWNPEKDLLAMVTEDSKILLHRFNWQRLWTISPGKNITSLCWRPDGKALAVGLEDGTVSLHDVENGKMLRSLKSHCAAVVSLNWEEDAQDECGGQSVYEDRTSRFFPPPPRAPRMSGLLSGETGFMEESEDLFRELANTSQQRFNILCSGDKDGYICFSIFGIFPIGKININNYSAGNPLEDTEAECRLQEASVYKVALSKDLCHLIVMCSGEIIDDREESDNRQMAEPGMHGLHCIVLDTSIFWKRKSELHQVAQQASNIDELTEVIRTSISVMHKEWSDAMRTFHDKFDSLSNLIVDHGLISTPREEFLSLLGGARTSPAVHQFLVNSLGEVGVKRMSKAVCGAGKELQLIILNHLQPAAEIIAFRMGELRGLSQWRARFQSIGLDEKLINDATEKSGMILVQVERFIRVLSSVVQQFSNFFNWLLKSIKLLNSEPSDHHLLLYDSELVAIFLKFLYHQDPVKQLLEASETDGSIEVGMEMVRRVKELVLFGGFSDCEHLRRTLAKEFQQMETSFKDAFQMPFTMISRQIVCEESLPLCSLPPSQSLSTIFPLSVSYYEDATHSATHQRTSLDYISFHVPDDSFSGVSNCIGIMRGIMQEPSIKKEGNTSVEAVLLCIPAGYYCVDLSLYKDCQIVLLLNETTTTSESSGDACMMIVQANDLPFVSITRSTSLDYSNLHQLKDTVVHLEMENEKVRTIPHSVTAPLAVSSSRGVACVFAARKRALVYILEEDEDEVSDTE